MSLTPRPSGGGRGGSSAAAAAAVAAQARKAAAGKTVRVVAPDRGVALAAAGVAAKRSSTSSTRSSNPRIPALGDAGKEASPAKRPSSARSSASREKEVQKEVRIRLESADTAESSRSTTQSTTAGQEHHHTIKVCARIRPLSDEERQKGQSNVTLVEGTASQRTVYDLVGQSVVESVADGFHGCVFAHGQTGSGKSHTIFGSHEDPGLLPRIGDGLFEGLKQGHVAHIVKLSYLEIYNEKLRDLLRPAVETDSEAKELHVRTHPKFGVFVEGLTSNVVKTPEDVKRLLDFGHKIRVVGRTNMNAASSRSHAVVTMHVELSFTSKASAGNVSPAGVMRRRAQLHVVDLAGSERMKQVGVQETRRHESISETKQINKSLWALELLISKLAAQEHHPSSASSHIPFRNSKLTHILSDSLMGNCRTVMVACISPSSSAFGVSTSTLQFAASAKRIRTRPVKNEEREQALIDSLKAEIELLRQQLNEAGADGQHDLHEQHKTTHLLLKQLSRSWEEDHELAVQLEDERASALRSLGLHNGAMAEAVRQGRTVVKQDADPYLVNVCDDPLLSGRLTYMLPCGEVVTVGSHPSCKIYIDGLGVQPEMCRIVCNDGSNVEVQVGNDDDPSGGRRSHHQRKQTIKTKKNEVVKKEGANIGNGAERLQSPTSLFKSGPAQVFVNHKLVQKTAPLYHGERLRIGRAHVFQLFIPRAEKNEEEPLVLDCFGSIAEQNMLEEHASHLRQRLGSQRALDVFSHLQELRHLVDEANDLTEELRGDETRDWVFKAHILTDVTSADDNPELAVVLRSSQKPLEIGEDGRPVYDTGRDPEITTVVWSELKFRQRLEVMRDLHHEVGDRDLPWGQPHDADAWKDDVGIPSVGSSGAARSPGLFSPASPTIVRNAGPRAAPEPDAEPRQGASDGHTLSLQAQHEYLVMQHQRALDFMAEKEMDLAHALADVAGLEAQLQEAKLLASSSDAARDEALGRLSVAEQELKKLRSEREAVAKEAIATAEMLAVAEAEASAPMLATATSATTVTPRSASTTSVTKASASPRGGPWFSKVVTLDDLNLSRNASPSRLETVPTQAVQMQPQMRAASPAGMRVSSPAVARESSPATLAAAYAQMRSSTTAGLISPPKMRPLAPGTLAWGSPRATVGSSASFPSHSVELPAQPAGRSASVPSYSAEIPIRPVGSSASVPSYSSEFIARPATPGRMVSSPVNRSAIGAKTPSKGGSASVPSHKMELATQSFHAIAHGAKAKISTGGLGVELAAPAATPVRMTSSSSSSAVTVKTLAAGSASLPSHSVELTARPVTPIRLASAAAVVSSASGAESRSRATTPTTVLTRRAVTPGRLGSSQTSGVVNATVSDLDRSARAIGVTVRSVIPGRDRA